MWTTHAQQLLVQSGVSAPAHLDLSWRLPGWDLELSENAYVEDYMEEGPLEANNPEGHLELRGFTVSNAGRLLSHQKSSEASATGSEEGPRRLSTFPQPTAEMNPVRMGLAQVTVSGVNPETS